MENRVRSPSLLPTNYMTLGSFLKSKTSIMILTLLYRVCDVGQVFSMSLDDGYYMVVIFLTYCHLLTDSSPALHHRSIHTWLSQCTYEVCAGLWCLVLAYWQSETVYSIPLLSLIPRNSYLFLATNKDKTKLDTERKAKIKEHSYIPEVKSKQWQVLYGIPKRTLAILDLNVEDIVLTHCRGSFGPISPLVEICNFCSISPYRFINVF